jgi:YesN/AraC family two-component response regulator
LPSVSLVTARKRSRPWRTTPDIDLLLLDINMPVMDGLTLLSVLRERRSEVRAIIVSVYGDMSNIRTAMNRGAFDFVTKPVDLNDLAITINKTLDDIARVRDLDRRRAAAGRARANLARYFSSISWASPAWPSGCRPKLSRVCCASSTRG